MPLEFTGSGRPLTQQAFDDALAKLGSDEAALWAILSVETRGFGYLADRRPKILFERHIFRNRTGGKFDSVAPDLSCADAGGYSGGAAEYGRLARAIALDRKAALESASWGLGQVMGFNATGLGYVDAEEMVAHFVADEDQQLDGAVLFLLRNRALHDALKAHQWQTVAFYYNGGNYAVNAYDTKLATAHALYAIADRCPKLRLRWAQAVLTYLNFGPRGVDGLMGPGTHTALLKFQQSQNLPQTAELDDATEVALKRALPL